MTTRTPRQIALAMVAADHAQTDCLLDMDLALGRQDRAEVDRLLGVYLDHSQKLLNYMTEMHAARRGKCDV